MIIAGKYLKVHVKEKIVPLNRKIILSVIILILCFSLDRISKIYIIDLFIKNNYDEYYLNPYINFIFLWNKGIAFGLFQSESLFYHLVTFLIFLVIGFILYLIFKAQKKIEIISFSMILGGAIGNFVDRIYYQAVPDFIDLHYKDFHWFTFNIADIWITIGIIMLLTFDIINNIIKKND